ncbi:MAG: hypothetical protein ACTHQM_25735 [Thermoanaerobaculia bacterium]
MTETISKERDTTGVYFRRIVTNADGGVISDERIKRDPVLTFDPPQPVSIAPTGVAVASVEMRLRDFDGAPRDDSGTITFRLRDRDTVADAGVTFSRPLIDGVVSLMIEFDTPGRYVIACDPPFAHDALLSGELVLAVTQ